MAAGSLLVWRGNRMIQKWIFLFLRFLFALDSILLLPVGGGERPPQYCPQDIKQERKLICRKMQI